MTLFDKLDRFFHPYRTVMENNLEKRMAKSWPNNFIEDAEMRSAYVNNVTADEYFSNEYQIKVLKEKIKKLETRKESLVRFGHTKKGFFETETYPVTDVLEMLLKHLGLTLETTAVVPSEVRLVKAKVEKKK